MAAPQTYRGFNITSSNYAVSGPINVQKYCNAVAIINIGDTIAFLNDVPVFPSTAPATIRGDSFTISGNELEEYKGNLKLKFQAPVGANPQVIILQQFYTDNY